MPALTYERPDGTITIPGILMNAQRMEFP